MGDNPAMQFGPGRYFLPRCILCDRGFIAPLKQFRERFPVCGRVAEQTHGCFAVPHGHGPKCELPVGKQFAAAKTRGSRDLSRNALIQPKELRQNPYRTQAQARD